MPDIVLRLTYCETCVTPLNHPRDDHPERDQCESEPVCGACAHLAELGAVAAATVAAGVHGDCQGIGAGEAADEDGDEQASEAAHPGYGATLVERDAAGRLGAGEPFHLLDEDRDELYGDHEDEHQLVDRHFEPL